ncbi:MAG: SMP-30/gluconolactonase/LRE family protein, partial [Planctomycetaceae bacterium]|nr:SMP-30/gluconolactonase/LRE family protein [Planctomycetaceae bacterium]
EFTEGPVADAEGNILFSDIPAGKIYRWVVPQDRPATSPPFEVETWLDPSGNTNGLCFDRNGLLLACQMGEGRRVVAIDPVTKTITPLAERFERKRLNAPNDLWVDATNGIWFTDPAYERTPADTELDTEAVYFISPDRTTVSRVAAGFARPNGIVGSPDGTTLYVTDRKAGMTWAFPVLGPGRLGERRKFNDDGCDGFAIDDHGNLYGTPKAPLVRIWAPDGKIIGAIPLPDSPSNITFGGPDRKTLFVTVKDKVFALPMNVSGGG